MHADEDGALARSAAFTTYLRDDEQLNLETTGDHTLSDRACRILINAAAPPKDWCYTNEQAADIYHATYHSAIKCSPHVAWYGEDLNAKDMHIWGCRILVPGHNFKKSQDCALEGKNTVSPRLGVCFIGLMWKLTTSSMHVALAYLKSTTCILILPLVRNFWI
jgi:hypothetical protein